MQVDGLNAWLIAKDSLVMSTNDGEYVQVNVTIGHVSVLFDPGAGGYPIWSVLHDMTT